jgi:hypothetical protein
LSHLFPNEANREELLLSFVFAQETGKNNQKQWELMSGE